MSVTIIYYEAKCKHCLFFHRRTKLNKNGNKSKVRPAFCGNIKSERG